MVRRKVPQGDLAAIDSPLDPIGAAMRLWHEPIMHHGAPHHRIPTLSRRFTGNTLYAVSQPALGNGAALATRAAIPQDAA